jgi:hypothetical protein
MVYRDETFIGSCFRYGDYLVSAYHVFAEGTYWKTPNSSWRSPIYAESVRRFKHDLDVAFIRIPSCDLTKLSAYKTFTSPPNLAYVTITGFDYKTGDWKVGRGNLSSKDETRHCVQHLVSTKPGFSGSPVIYDGRVVGVHIGARPHGAHNVMVLFDIFAHRLSKVADIYNVVSNIRNSGQIDAESSEKRRHSYRDDEEEYEIRFDKQIMNAIRSRRLDFGLGEAYVNRHKWAIEHGFEEFLDEHDMADFVETGQVSGHGSKLMNDLFREYELSLSGYSHESATVRPEELSNSPDVEDFRHGSQVEGVLLKQRAVSNSPPPTPVSSVTLPQRNMSPSLERLKEDLFRKPAAPNLKEESRKGRRKRSRARKNSSKVTLQPRK